MTRGERRASLSGPCRRSRPIRGRHERPGLHPFWASLEGLPNPVGVTWIAEEEAWNFAVYSEHAEHVTLLLYTSEDPATPVLTQRLDHLRNKSGPIWHCRIPTTAMKEARFYAYRVEGPRSPRHPFDAEKILFDPYARALHFPPGFDRQAAIGPGANAGCAPLGLIAADRERFDWADDRRPRHEVDAVIYELHVRGFTAHPRRGRGRGPARNLRGPDRQDPVPRRARRDGGRAHARWTRLEAHRDVFRFARLMIGFRKAHPSLCRSRFWRDDVHWYGVATAVDLSHGSRTLAYRLSGVSQGDDDLYVMVNAYWEPLEFVVQEGRPSEWHRVVDTARESPGDIREPDRGVVLTSARCTVGPRSVVVLVRPRSL